MAAVSCGSEGGGCGSSGCGSGSDDHGGGCSGCAVSALVNTRRRSHSLALIAFSPPPRQGDLHS